MCTNLGIRPGKTSSGTTSRTESVGAVELNRLTAIYIAINDCADHLRGS